MDINILFIFLFITIFMLCTAILYSYLLKNKEIEKRLNYYLDIENKYREKKEQVHTVKNMNFKETLKYSNEYLREILKKGLPGKNQKRIEQQLHAAGVNLKPEEYTMAIVFCSVVAGGGFYLLFNHIFFLFAGLIFGAFLPKLWLNSKKKKRIQKFNDSLLEMITIIVGSLKAGYSFSQAMKTVAEESDSPVKEEIQTMLNELNYGISMEEALNNLKTRMPSSDLELMIHAILIQRQIGGNLSIILGVIINTIRERNKLEKHVRTLTAQGRMTGIVLGLLPVIIGLAFFLISRDMMMEFFSNRIGQVAMAVGVMLTISGYVVINRITKIEV